MDEVAMYRQQLEQIQLALIDEPGNNELLKLQDDLNDLINLMLVAAEPQQNQQQQQHKNTPQLPTPASSKSLSPLHTVDNNDSATPVTKGQPTSPSPTTAPTPTNRPASEWKVGEKCKARWAQDGKFYEAQITAASERDVFSVTFTQYGDVALVRANDLRPLNAATNGTSASDTTEKGSAQKRKQDGNGEKPQRKKKGNGKSEVVEKQQSWLNFAKKGPKSSHGKKGVAPMAKKSMFSTPDNPNAKVGVIGSGAGMTSFVQRGKHIYEDNH